MKKLGILLITLLLLFTGFAMAAPSYCNRVEAGSYIDMTVANVVTTSETRFIVPDADDKVELNYGITVTDLEGLSSIGEAAAYMEVVIHEGRNSSAILGDMFEEIRYTDSTSIFGSLMFFNKNMHYESA